MFRSQIFDPLGMKSTTFYPFGDTHKDKVLPLRWLEHKSDGSTEWQKLEGQCDLLDLPRRCGFPHPLSPFLYTSRLLPRHHV